MLSLLADFIIQFAAFIFLVKTSNAEVFAAIIAIYFVVSYLFSKKVPSLLFYCLLFSGAILFRLGVPSVLEWILLAGVLLSHLFVSSRTKSMGAYRISAVLLASGAGFLLIHIVPYISMALRSILSLIVSIFAWMVGGPLVFLVGLIDFNGEKETEERLKKAFQSAPEEIPAYNGGSGNHILIYSILMLLALVGLFLIYRLAKKRLGRYNRSSLNTNISLYQSTEGKKSRHRAPKDAVRKIVFAWEKKLSTPYARNSGESFSAWVKRLSLDFPGGLDADLLISVYSDVRYKEETAAQSDVKKFKEEMSKFSLLKKRN
ncbi:DUF4018 domain-containing protein [Peribacillus deserti]|uniref:DUF4129 domain-containing protein n=1 Tax=Peribacillus deserti TaxID=673318 RepID=A0A2N5M2D3_9BACI|nr:DUF4018 domain-containing protein [Peribacillus deserti]PLT28528.1 hypothetical protein CUU66_18190 [Peribacillus deserti]